MQKNIILIVDNRGPEENVAEPGKSLFRGSAFKATEVDPLDLQEASVDEEDQHTFLSQLQDRIIALEQRIKHLERSSKQDRMRRRIRRKANQISREFKCPHKDCQKLYGSETSLKNHLKLKHGRLTLKTDRIDC